MLGDTGASSSIAAGGVPALFIAAKVTATTFHDPDGQRLKV